MTVMCVGDRDKVDVDIAVINRISCASNVHIYMCRHTAKCVRRRYETQELSSRREMASTVVLTCIAGGEMRRRC